MTPKKKPCRPKRLHGAAIYLRLVWGYIQIKTGIRQIRMEDVPVPQPAPDQTFIKVMAVAICGSDVHYFEHGSSAVIWSMAHAANERLF
ncbi:hypothetical protein [Paenibacillus sp. FSL H8-0034]|uniref:hypothetical protein n=1 Tax=Paenibacillus sp. FSL H8-0034 TaxID=2954671 RepID=UPI0030F76AE6